MIVTEVYEENPDLVKTYSDAYFKIRNTETGDIYDTVVDPANSGRVYEETSQYVEGYDPVEHGVSVYSKYKIVKKLMEKGYWTATKEWLNESGYIDLWNAAIEFADDDDNFNNGVETFKTKFGVSQEVIDELLNDCLK